MRIQITLQPEDEIIGGFEMDVLPRIGDKVYLQRKHTGYQSGYVVSDVHWTFDTSFSRAFAQVQIDISRAQQPAEPDASPDAVSESSSSTPARAG